MAKLFVMKLTSETTLLTHTGEKPYQCDICHISFAFRTTLHRHKKNKHVTEIERGETTLEMKQIKYKAKIGVPKEKIRIFPCNICDKQFYNSEKLENHMLRFHEESQTKQLYYCNTCPR